MQLVGSIVKAQSLQINRILSDMAPGAVHAPLHVNEEWIDKFQGQFNQGWDKVREETLARQKKLGIVPKKYRLDASPRQYSSLGCSECR